jgi:predicted XRE-type DNA-binding protein
MRKRNRLTAEIAAKIKQLAKETKLYQHEIAALVGVNQGRVSEVLNGKRFPTTHPNG